MTKTSIDNELPISTHSWFNGSILNQNDNTSWYDDFDQYDGIFDNKTIINQNDKIIELLSSIDTNLKKLVDDKSSKESKPQKKPLSNVNHNLEGINI